MSIGHKHRHTGRRPRRFYLSRFRAERHCRQREPRVEHGPYGPGHVGWPSEMMHSMNAESSSRSMQSWAAFSPMPKPCSLPHLERVPPDGIAPAHNIRRLPCNDEPC